MPTKDSKPLPRFLLGDDAAQPVSGIGAMLDGEQRLQLQGLLDVEGGELVAGLRHLQGSDRRLRAQQHAPSRRPSPSIASLTWPCSKAARRKPACASSQRLLAARTQIVAGHRIAERLWDTAARTRHRSRAPSAPARRLRRCGRATG